MIVPISITLPQFSISPGPMFEATRTAEALGFTGVFLFDHLVPIGNAHRPVLEGAASLGALAAVSKAIRVGTLVLRISLRPPEVSAAIAAAAQAVAPGRVVLGLGVGDRLSDAEAIRFGMPRPGREERLALLVETIRLVRKEAPEAVIWVGGRHRLVRELAADLADGWNAWDAEPERFAEETAAVKERAPRPITVSWGGAVRPGTDGAGAIERLRGVVAAGADELVLSILPHGEATWRTFLESAVLM